MNEQIPLLQSMFASVLAGMELEGTLSVAENAEGEIEIVVEGDGLDAMVGRDGAVLLAAGDRILKLGCPATP